ncbi:MAG: hypothetical protein CMO97_01820 [Woeseia sp.]|nr:hypothetical protein [Woeseia sp.]|tara:strand:- start:15578 stop:16624 length:1047 start_codon:yes stop_codon:yes gene_type:complete
MIKSKFIIIFFMTIKISHGAVYDLPVDGQDVIGSISSVTSKYEDTLVDISRRHGLGYLEIIQANPGINPWFPGEGVEIILPSKFILPPGPRKGLVLNLAEYRMYYYPETPLGETPKVHTYPMSIGRINWETPTGLAEVIGMARNPTWYPPQSVREEHAAEGDPLPAIVPPGPENPLGTRVLRLNMPGYLIHGTNRPAGVGMRVSHGCIRMFPEDIEFLYDRINLKTKVRIIDVPIKIGWDEENLVIEAHRPLEKKQIVLHESKENLPSTDEYIDSLNINETYKDPLAYVTEQFILATKNRSGELDWRIIDRVTKQLSGIPVIAGKSLSNFDYANEETIKNATTGVAFQ